MKHIAVYRWTGNTFDGPSSTTILDPQPHHSRVIITRVTTICKVESDSAATSGDERDQVLRIASDAAPYAVSSIYL